MNTTTTYRYLVDRPDSRYRQLFLIGPRKIRAETIYRLTVGPEPRSPEEVAADYGLPLAAVAEAIDYSLQNEDLLRAERDSEAASIQSLGLDSGPTTDFGGAAPGRA